jgi:hypothetical protein
VFFLIIWRLSLPLDQTALQYLHFKVHTLQYRPYGNLKSVINAYRIDHRSI